MTKNTFDVKYLANLARIELSPQEEEKLDSELPRILEYVSELKKVNTEGADETANITGLTNVLRKDKEGQVKVEDLKKNRDELLSGVAETKDGFIKVPAIINEN